MKGTVIKFIRNSLFFLTPSSRSRTHDDDGGDSYADVDGFS